MTKLELLYAQKSEKFSQVCTLAARELGYGELSTLSVEDRIRAEDQAKQYVEQWEEMGEMKTNFTIRSVTPLRRLLAEYHEICERIPTSMTLTPVFGPTGKEPRSGDARRRFKTSAPTKHQTGPRLRSAPLSSCHFMTLRQRYGTDSGVVLIDNRAGSPQVPASPNTFPSLHLVSPKAGASVMPVRMAPEAQANRF